MNTQRSKRIRDGSFFMNGLPVLKWKNWAASMNTAIPPAAIGTNGLVLAAGGRSAIFGYTSLFAPANFGNAGVNAFGDGGGTSAQGLTPLAVPEPGPLALGAVGGLMFALSAWRRGRKLA